MSDRNAYRGATIDPATGLMTGGGVNPTAIVGVTLPARGDGTDPTVLDTGYTHVGIQDPILSGMVRVGDIGKATFSIEALGGENGGAIHPLQKAVLAPTAAFTIDPAQLVGASANDWVAFTASIGSIGRRHEAILTGRDGTSDVSNNGWLAYSMTDLPNQVSPPLHVTVPEFQLPLPAHSGLTVYVSGAVECQNGANGLQTVEIDIYADQVIDTKLAALNINVPHANSAISGSVWDGLLIPYTGQVVLSVDSNGNVLGPAGNSGEPHPQVYQYIRERWGVPNSLSQDIGV